MSIFDQKLPEHLKEAKTQLHNFKRDYYELDKELNPADYADGEGCDCDCWKCMDCEYSEIEEPSEKRAKELRPLVAEAAMKVKEAEAVIAAIKRYAAWRGIPLEKEAARA